MRDSYLPSLLDRLETSRAGAGDGITLDEYRRLVYRDIQRLLNHATFFTSPDPSGRRPLMNMHGLAELYPNVASSVLNYGFDVPTGQAAGSRVGADLAANLKTALETFEPRLANIHVAIDEEPSSDESKSMEKLRFRQAVMIQADLLAEPFPVDLAMKTEVDLISGRCDFAFVGEPQTG